MSQLDDLFGDAAAVLSDDLADTVGYSPDGVATPIDVVAIIGHEETRAIVEQDGTKTRHVRTVSFPRTAQASGGGSFLAQLYLHDQLTIAGVVYTVEAITSQTVNWTKVEAYRLVTREKTRQGYRRTA